MKPDERDPFIDRLIEGLEPPQPPTDLRSRVLAAARQHTETESPDLWIRIWNLSGVRLAWAGAAALLLAGHVFLVPSKGAVPGRVDPGLVAENRVDEQFVDLLRPIQISANVQPMVGLFASEGDPIDLEMKGNPS